MYYDYALAAPLLAGVIQKEAMSDVLILGMGTGTFATQCRNYFSGALNIEGVEIDQKITDLAETYFDLSDEIPVTTYDGRAYLQAVDKTYDVIMVDAYQDITIPFQMSSQEFFSEVKAHLKPNGVMVVNMNMKSDGEDSINAYLSDTIASVFDQVYTADVKNNTNRELFASDNPQMLELMNEAISVLPDQELASMMETVSGAMTAYEAGELILTDDQAPVEVLGMRVIDELIREEIGYYKDIFKKHGIQGILEVM